jgi:hypothetical protein
MNDTILPRALADDAPRGASGLRGVLGDAAWLRLPEAVRERFADHASAVTYAGAYELVRASAAGRVFAWLGTLFGHPVVTRGGHHVAARVHVRPVGRGVEWLREYQWQDGRRETVRSTKVVTGDHELVECLPARLHMPLRVYEQGGVLHFVSRGYHFDLGFGCRLPLPAFLSPGVTHVEHVDLGHGWFRFTLWVTHPWFGEMFFQTGRFCAAAEPA